jgi:hypothetical protein
VGLGLGKVGTIIVAKYLGDQAPVGVGAELLLFGRGCAIALAIVFTIRLGALLASALPG